MMYGKVSAQRTQQHGVSVVPFEDVPENRKHHEAGRKEPEQRRPRERKAKGVRFGLENEVTEKRNEIPDFLRDALPEAAGILLPDQVVEEDAHRRHPETLGQAELPVDLLDEEELMAVLGHELGHVKCGHVLYRSIAYFLAHIASRLIGLGGLATMGLAVALFEWSRKSELTADRAELLVVQDVDVCIRLHMKLSAGSRSVFAQTDAQEFLRQAETYEDLDYSTLNKVYKFLQELYLTHPLPVYRAKEIKAWNEGKQFAEIMAGRYPTQERETALRTCPHCGSKISPSFFFCPDCGKNARV